ncbi:hypothetical protein OC835_005690 [Tilletia horrida]|nr:hypothetical protein OC835_005690 [Tilletia horrida]
MSKRAATTHYPTSLVLTGDVILANRDEEDGTGLIRVFFFDARSRSVEGHLLSPCSDDERDGWFTIRHVPATTRPLRLLDGGDEFMRQVPEEVDGSDPSKVVMDWTTMLASGIGVVKEFNNRRKHGLLMGFTLMGDKNGWTRFDLRFKFDGLVSIGSLQVHTLVSFEAILARIDEDGIPFIQVYNLVPLGKADSDLTAALTE